jgi:hypothetical protein
MLGAAETIQREDLRRDSIEKVSIVTDRDDRSFIRGERFFECFRVKVLSRWLVGSSSTSTFTRE